jgi:hypothetical protein
MWDHLTMILTFSSFTRYIHIAMERHLNAKLFHWPSLTSDFYYASTWKTTLTATQI